MKLLFVFLFLGIFLQFTTSRLISRTVDLQITESSREQTKQVTEEKGDQDTIVETDKLTDEIIENEDCKGCDHSKTKTDDDTIIFDEYEYVLVDAKDKNEETKEKDIVVDNKLTEEITVDEDDNIKGCITTEKNPKCSDDSGIVVNPDDLGPVYPIGPLPYVEPGSACGPGVGICPGQQCCSSSYFCGISDEHCNIEKGCLVVFGSCGGEESDRIGSRKDISRGERKHISSFGSQTETNGGRIIQSLHKGFVGQLPYVMKGGRCGPGIGVCNKQCCSAYNSCGNSEEHCSLSKGCREDFGICNDSIKH